MRHLILRVTFNEGILIKFIWHYSCWCLLPAIIEIVFLALNRINKLTKSSSTVTLKKCHQFANLQNRIKKCKCNQIWKCSHSSQSTDSYGRTSGKKNVLNVTRGYMFNIICTISVKLWVLEQVYNLSTTQVVKW